MIPCPSCQNSVDIQDKHWGTLFTCPHCNAVYFIDWNGQPELASHEPEPVNDEQVPTAFEGAYETDFQNGASDFQSGTDFQAGGFQGDFASAGDAFSNPTPHHNFEGNIPESVPDEYAPPEEPILDSAEEIPAGSEFVEYTPNPEIVNSFGQDTQYAPADVSTGDTSFAEASADSSNAEETPYDFSNTLDSLPPENPLADSSDFSDVANFANSDVSAGPLSYTVIIEGLENSQLVNALREAMSDSKFGWDVEEILSSVGHGRLIIKDINPTKAFVFISRIKYLPLKISWRQNVL